MGFPWLDKPRTTPRYLDIDVDIGPGQDHKYPLRVHSDAAGTAHQTLEAPFETPMGKELLQGVLETLRDLGPEAADAEHVRARRLVKRFGDQLHDALFTGDARSLYDVSKVKATETDRRLRLRLVIRAPDLAIWPWEFLYDSSAARYLCLSRTSPVVRNLAVKAKVANPMDPPLRILCMAASPRGLDNLDVAGEKRTMQQALEEAQEEGLVELHFMAGQTWQDLQATVLDHGPWHVFHFIGHGQFDEQSGEACIVLADERGHPRPLMAPQLGQFLYDHNPLRLVLLNACKGARGSADSEFSSAAVTLVRQGILAVLAMQYSISDTAAKELSRTFYKSLGRGWPVESALAEARKAMDAATDARTVEWGTPVLYSRCPNGQLFPPRSRVWRAVLLAAACVVALCLMCGGGYWIYKTIKPGIANKEMKPDTSVDSSPDTKTRMHCDSSRERCVVPLMGWKPKCKKKGNDKEELPSKASFIAIGRPNNTIYVSDPNCNSVRTITCDDKDMCKMGKLRCGWKFPGPTGPVFRRPYGLAVGRSGNLYVADSEMRRLLRITGLHRAPDKEGVIGKAEVVVGFHDVEDGRRRGPLSGFVRLRGLAADARENIYVADRGQMIVWKVTNAAGPARAKASLLSRFEDPPGISEEDSGPTGIAVDSKGLVYVTIPPHGKIYRVPTREGGAPLGPLEAPNPYGITVGPSGVVYFTEPATHGVWRIEDQKKILLAGKSEERVHEGPARRVRLHFPAGLTFGAGGKLYVVDRDNSRLILITPRPRP